jgi:hypothetical protein
MKRVLRILAFVVLLVLAGFIYFNYYFVFGDGEKAGNMNYFVHKGYVFKTYEGRLILNGVTSPVQGTVQSNDFMFSVTSQKVADTLNKYAGAYVQLHYKEYVRALPWRGFSKYIADSVISVKPASTVR